MHSEKSLTRVTGQHVATGAPLRGYEIHIGQTNGPDCARPFATIDGTAEGAASANGRIVGTYLHGLFSDDQFRAAWLAGFGVQAGQTAYDTTVETTLDALADHMEAHLDVAGLLACAR